MLGLWRLAAVAVVLALGCLLAVPTSDPLPVWATARVAHSGSGLNWTQTTFINTANTFGHTFLPDRAALDAATKGQPDMPPRETLDGYKKTYSPEALALAIDAAAILGANEAARRHEIPPSTLKGKLKQQTEIEPAASPARSHGNAMLSDAAQTAIDTWIAREERARRAPTKQEVLQKVLEFAEKDPPATGAGKKLLAAWKAAGQAGEKAWRTLKAKFPTLGTKKGNYMESSHVQVTQAALQSLPDTLKPLLAKHPHLQNAKYWFQTDEAPLSAAAGRKPVLVTHKG